MFPKKSFSAVDLAIGISIIFCLYAAFGLGGYLEKKDSIRLTQLESARHGPEAIVRNGGKLASIQQGNVHYFYQIDPTNGARIPLPDYKVMLNAFDSTARLSGPVASISPEIIPYNGRLAYMGMWVTFMPGRPIEVLR